MNEKKVSEPSVEEFLKGIKAGTPRKHSAWVYMAGLLFWRRRGL